MLYYDIPTVWQGASVEGDRLELPVLAISAMTGQGMESLLQLLETRVKEGLDFAELEDGVHEFRRTMERMAPADYLNASYFEKWLHTLEGLLIEKGEIDRAELEAAWRVVK